MRAFQAIVTVAFVSAGAIIATPSALSSVDVVVRRLPEGGLQPRVAGDQDGAIHVVYLRGNPANADAFYIRSRDGGATFTEPIQVNSVPGTTVATGTVRGAQIAVGRDGRVHIAWNGSYSTALGATPMFYTRLNDTGTDFEPQRAIAERYNIDGGGAVAADRRGHVYLVWHANSPGERSEGQRRVWVARSVNDGLTFEKERPVFDEPTGACGCCGLGAFADADRSVFVLFRSAFDVIHRDMYLLMSRDAGRSFSGEKIDDWNVGACVMSTQAFAEGPSGIYTAWETEGQVYMGRVEPATGSIRHVVSAPGHDRTRKHPALAVNAGGDVLLAWTEGTAWKKGGAAAWQVFDKGGEPIGPPGHTDGVPVWGLVAAYAGRNGFSVTF